MLQLQLQRAYVVRVFLLALASCLLPVSDALYTDIHDRSRAEALFSRNVGSAEGGLTPYTNPIISGFAPDPSCIRVGDQYFCVNSSFSAFPGIPVYTSRDLVQWKQIGNVLSRPEQLPALNTINTTTGGIWAATIRYHDGIFYVTTTLVKDYEPVDSTEQWDNVSHFFLSPLFIFADIFANNGNGWSDPVHFTFQGYDTSLFWDNDGTVYVQGSHYWRVYPAIQQFAIDLKTGKSLSGNPVTLWNGTGGLAPEGPHVYKRNDGYYLLIAEGGTGLNHMVTMARAPNISGPYTSYAKNPVLTNANTTEYLQTVGHADLFQDTAGNWWAVSLATRNGTVNYPMGRETILVPVVWEENEFPVFNNGTPGRAHIHMTGPLPPKQPPIQFPTPDPLVGHSQYVTFTSDAPLPRQLVYYRYPDFTRFSVSPVGHANTLCILGAAANITGAGGVGTSTFVARRQDALEFTATVTLAFSPELENACTQDEEAGMTLFIQREQHFDLGIAVMRNASTGSGNGELQKFMRLRTIDANASADGLSDAYSQPGLVPLSSTADVVRLKVQALNASTYAFSYAYDEIGNESESKWIVVGYGAAREVSGGFTGILVGMYATGNGKNSTTPAFFSDFSYDPVQGVF
ncbi:hypothetical protein EW145_g7505 [Phellinidium pouzarii]|uniref:Beta-xylosidase C-terminal Concanavalin A-like domain-containing protein n=1 Tax=Phellinidium pouzarii TaxID=167371 RepID=A0A4S4KJ51_9AGAM|nr:hypothetical protein EW145_g7505 [Phellinidium pouzarii]